jgi:hypothetical protein
MFQFATPPFNWLTTLTFSVALMAGQAQADGKIGDHVNNLEAHIDKYTEEVNWLIGKVDGIVESYETKGTKAAKPAKLVDYWEEVKFHDAIETNYVPLYASIWQGLYGVREAIEQEKPVAEVRKQQQMLEQTLWQSLGAIKMAAKVQSENETAAKGGEARSPVATIDEIKQNLDMVVVEFTEKEFEAANELVHETYETRFEGIEGTLIEQDAELVEDLEKDFNVSLPKQLNADASIQDVKKVVNTMKQKLNKARKLLDETEKNKRSVF